MPIMIFHTFSRFIDRLGGTKTSCLVFSAASPAESVAPIKNINSVSKANCQQGRPRPAAKPHTSIETEIDPEPLLQPHLFSIVSPGQKSFISNLQINITLEKFTDVDSFVRIDFGDSAINFTIPPHDFQIDEVDFILSKLRMSIHYAVKKHHEL
jgi:hypothetical protein